LDKSADDFRVRDVFAFNAFSAQRLELTRNGTTYVWEKSTPDGDAAATWSRVQPTAGDVNQTTMTDLLNALAAIRADAFEVEAPAAGTADETIGIVVRFDAAGSEQEERATLHRTGETAHAVRADEPGAAVIPVADVETVIGHIEAL